MIQGSSCMRLPFPENQYVSPVVHRSELPLHLDGGIEVIPSTNFFCETLCYPLKLRESYLDWQEYSDCKTIHLLAELMQMFLNILLFLFFPQYLRGAPAWHPGSSFFKLPIKAPVMTFPRPVGLLYLLLTALPLCSGLVIDLKTKDDARSVFHITSFGYEEKGVFEFTLKDFVLLVPSSHKKEYNSDHTDGVTTTRIYLPRDV
eukprot:1394388-Amorphochlora_amoeboformis.AAC.1